MTVEIIAVDIKNREYITNRVFNDGGEYKEVNSVVYKRDLFNEGKREAARIKAQHIKLFNRAGQDRAEKEIYVYDIIEFPRVPDKLSHFSEIILLENRFLVRKSIWQHGMGAVDIMTTSDISFTANRSAKIYTINIETLAHAKSFGNVYVLEEDYKYKNLRGDSK